MSLSKAKLIKLFSAAIVVALGAGCISYYFLSSSRDVIAAAWCEKASSATCTYKSKPSSCQLFRKKDGQLLLVLAEQGNVVYRILPNERKVYFSSIHRLKILPTGAWDKRTGDVNPYGVDLGYQNGVKVGSIRADTDAKMIVRGDYIEFNDLQADKVTVSW